MLTVELGELHRRVVPFTCRCPARAVACGVAAGGGKALLSPGVAMQDPQEASSSAPSEASVDSTVERASAALEAAGEAVSSVGYARLTGAGKGAVDYLVRATDVSIGRAGYGADCQVRSESRAVSRRHARLFWDTAHARWQIECLPGKNGLLVDGAPVVPGSPPMPLRSRNLIEMGDAAFFFLAATHPTFLCADLSQFERSIAAFRRSKLGRAGAQSTDDEDEEDGRESRGHYRERYDSEVEAPERRGVRSKYRSDTPDHDIATGRRYEDPRGSSPATHSADGDMGAHYPERAKPRRRKPASYLIGGRGDGSGRYTHSGVRHPGQDVDGRRPVYYEMAEDGRIDAIPGGDEEEPIAPVKRKPRRPPTPSGKGKRKPSTDKSSQQQPVKKRRRGGGRGAARADDNANAGEYDSVVSHFREEWNKKERTDFGRALFAIGVDEVRDEDGNGLSYDWSRFRNIAELPKKSDEMLAAYYTRMMADVEALLEEEEREKRTKGPRTKHKPGCDCVVCENTRKSRRKKREENADAEDGSGAGAAGDGDDDDDGAVKSTGRTSDRLVGLVTAQKLRVRLSIHEAARQVDSIAGQAVMQKLGSQNTYGGNNGELPHWWVNGTHDRALLVGTTHHGVGQWLDIWHDDDLEEFVQARIEQGPDIAWPSQQAAMKRLREVSSAINAEIRRLVKRAARRVSDNADKASHKRTRGGNANTSSPALVIDKVVRRGHLARPEVAADSGDEYEEELMELEENETQPEAYYGGGTAYVEEGVEVEVEIEEEDDDEEDEEASVDDMEGVEEEEADENLTASDSGSN